MSERYKFHDNSKLYFVSPTVVGWIDLFTKKQYCEIIIDSLKYCQDQKGLIIYAWCIMSSHLHLIISSKSEDLSAIMRDFKKHTSKKIIKELTTGNDSRKEWVLNIFKQEAAQIKRNTNYKVWQDGNHPILLDTNIMLDQRLNYLHNNPIEQGIVFNLFDYAYSSAADYAGEKGMLEIFKIE
jgi:putative transposase